MVSRRLAKFPGSLYHNGKEVYIKIYGKDSGVKRGGKSIKAPRVFEAVICQSHASNYRYKVEFINFVGMKTKEWIKVNEITSRKYEKEKKKKTKARSLIPAKTKESRIQSPVNLMESYKQMQKNILETIQNQPLIQLSNGITVNFEDSIHHKNGWNSYLTELSIDGTWGTT